MRNFYLFLSIVLLYFIIIYLNSSLIQTESKMIAYLSKDYPDSVVNDFLESERKFWWISYVATFLLIGIKILLVAFCLNFIKLFEFEGLEKVKFSDFVFIVLVAECVFVIAGFYKFVNFYWIDTDNALENLQTYFPISLINLREYISTEKWLAYPLQLINLFELFYWGIIAWGIWELLEQKVNPIKSFGLVALTYGVGLMFWVSIVIFFILNAQY